MCGNIGQCLKSYFTMWENLCGYRKQNTRCVLQVHPKYTDISSDFSFFQIINIHIQLTYNNNDISSKHFFNEILKYI